MKKQDRVIIILFILMLCVLSASANQTNDSDKYTFDNYGGEKFTPQPMEFGENLQNKGQDGLGVSSSTKANETERKHMLLQFYETPNEDQLKLLEEYGVKRVGVAAPRTLIVSMPASLTPADLPAEAGLRWMGEIPVENKYDRIFGLNVPEWARMEDGQVEILVYFHEDVSFLEAQSLAEQYSSRIPHLHYYPYPLYTITTEENNLTPLASEDIVLRLAFPEPEPVPAGDISSNAKPAPGFQSLFTVLMLLVVFSYLKRETFP